MPQTEEEHLENQNLDYDDHEKTHPDAEVRPTFRYIDFFLGFFYGIFDIFRLDT